MNLFSEAIVAIDGSTFKAGNNRDKNFNEAQAEGPDGAARKERGAISQRASFPRASALRVCGGSV
jgi:hypothetical protein